MGKKIDYKKAKSNQEAYDLVKNNITAEKIQKFKVNAELKYYPENNKIVASGTGFTLTMVFRDSRVEMDLDLSFILKPLRGKIEGALENEIQKVV
jgi:hypothetical protein